MTGTLIAGALATTCLLSLAPAALGSKQAARGGCPVTIPTRVVPEDAGQTAAAFNYGSARLRAHLFWPRGTLPAGTLPDGGSYAVVTSTGAIWVKLGWWRGTVGRLAVSGQRLDRPGRLRASVPTGYGPKGFVPVGMTFPTVGCWRVVGVLGPAQLSFVVRVTKLPTR